MTDDRLLDDLGAAADGAALDGARCERLDDLLRPAEVAGRFRTALDGDEAARLIWRATRAPWIRRETDAARVELRRFDDLERARRLEADPDAALDDELALAACADPALRRRRRDAALDRDARRSELVHELRELADDAARRIGAAAYEETVEVGESVDRRAFLAATERGALVPLDDAIAAACRDRWARSREVLIGVDDPGDVPAVYGLVEHGELVSRRAIERALDEACGAFGGRPPLRPPAVGPDAAPWTTVERAALRSGTLDGPVALVRGLEALGRTVRARFLDELVPARRRWLDPTFEIAAARLFGRLSLAEALRDAAGVGRSRTVARELRLEAALAPRLAWAYVPRRAGDGAEAGRPAFRDRLRRAAGRPEWPGEWTERACEDSPGIGLLRGEMLAILVEERLLTRHGHRWFAERRARDELRELWDAERTATPEDVASAFGLGTMDSSTIVERCRP